MVITMMNSTRNSMPWNQMMANTTHDSAGMPWKKVSTGAMKFSAVFDWPMIIARMPPRMKAPNSPPKMRPAVSSTSIRRDPVVSDLDRARENLRYRREQIMWEHHGQDLPTRRQHDQAGGGLQNAHGARIRHCIDLA